MSIRSTTLKVVWYSLIYLVVTVVVLAAVALTLARIWLPTAEDYKDDAEKWVSGFLGQQIVIESLNADWRGFEPQLVLEKVQLLSEDGETIISAFDKVKIGFDLFSSLLRQTVIPGGLVVEGAQLVLIRQVDGRFSISGFNAASQGQEDEQETNKLLETLLLDQRLLKIENSSLVWRDRTNKDETRLFSDVNLTLRNDGSRHQIEGSVFLPQDLGSHVLFFMDLRGDIFSSSDWSGSAQLTAVGIEVVNWIKDRRVANLELAKAVVSTSSWARIRSGQVEELRGEVLASNVQIRSRNNPRLNKIDSISSDFALEFSAGVAQLTLESLTLIHNGKIWPKLRADTRIDMNEHSLELEMSELNIDNAIQLALISDVIDKTAGVYLQEARPRGKLENITMFANIKNKDQPVYALGGRFRDVELYRTDGIPGIKGLAGEFEASNQDGYIWFDAAQWSIDYPGMFKKGRNFDHFSGSVTWHRDEQSQWHLFGNNIRIFDAHAEAKGQFRIRIEPERAPFLDLAVGLSGVDITNVKKYLPDAMMADSLVAWISESVKKVSVKGGGLVYYGYTDQYPFNARDGHFGLNLILQNTDLKFLPDWPQISDINGEFDMDSHGLQFSSHSARVYSNRIENVQVSIANFYADQTRLAIAGSVSGSTSDKFRYMFESPLNDIFASNLNVFEVSGDSELLIGLDIPLYDEGELSVSGKLLARDNRLYAESLDVDLNKITGKLRFDQNGIYGEDILVNFGELPLLANVNSVDNGKGREIVFNHKGMLKHDQLSYVLDKYAGQPQWQHFVEGQSLVDVNLYIPMLEGGSHKQITLEGRSELEGMQLKLPAPFAKTTDERWPFYISTELGGEESAFDLMLGDTQLAMQLRSAGGRTSVEKGAVGFGVTPELPTEHGFHFIGELDRFYWSDWQPLLMPGEGEQGLLQQDGGGGSVYFDVFVNEGEAFNARFTKTRVQASNTAQGWTIHGSGPEVQGSVYLPSVWNSAPVVVDAERLHIKVPPTDKESAQINPGDLPILRFNSSDFSYNDMLFGNTEFETSLVPNGMRLNKFISRSKIADFDVTGSWVLEKNIHKSDFSAKMKAKNFGASMESWGYKDILTNGDGDMSVTASWQGSPTEFSFPTLRGSIDVNMNNVRLLDLNVGMVKMLGLLSLEAIPRRLFFDFRDVVQKGVTFDSVQGQFDVQNGDAFTSGMVLTGPTGRMGLAGRIGLADEEYDLVITFIPKVLDALPVIGGVASGGLAALAPQVGAIYIMQKLLSSQVDELSAVQYTVTGSWQEPAVTQVKAPSRQQGESEFVDEQ